MESTLAGLGLVKIYQVHVCLPEWVNGYLIIIKDLINFPELLVPLSGPPLILCHDTAGSSSGGPELNYFKSR